MKRFLFLLLFALTFTAPAVSLAAPLVASDVRSPTITRKVETLAELKALTASDRVAVKSVYVEGRTSKGDGGRGVFYWLSGDQSTNPDVVADTSLEGVYVKPAVPGTGATGVWVREFTDTVFLEWWGATGDGITDDSSGVQAAFSFALRHGKKLGGMSGNQYLCLTGIVVAGEDYDRFTFEAATEGGLTLKTTAPIDLLTLSGVPANTFQYPTLRNIRFNVTDPSGVSVRTKNTEFLLIENCIFSGVGDGLVMSTTGGDSDIKPKIVNNTFFGLARGIYGGDTRQADGWYENNLFINCTIYGLILGYPDGATVVKNKFFSDVGAANNATAVLLKKPIYFSVSDNDFFEYGGSGLVLTSPRYGRVNDNRFINLGTNSNAVALSISDFTGVNGRDVIISKNTFKDCNGPGVWIVTSALLSGFTLEKNDFENVGDGATIHDAILLSGVVDVDILNNKIDGKGATRYWLNIDNSTGVKLFNNDHKNLVNPDVFRSGTVSMRVLPTSRTLTGVTATYTALFDDDHIIGGALAGSIFINLPSAAAAPGKRFCITKTDASIYSLTIDPAASQTWDGATTKNVSSQYETVCGVSDGANWVTE